MTSTSPEPLLLDAFSCAGLGADGYRRAGFKVVCLDNDHKPLKWAKEEGHEVVQGDAMKLLKDKVFMKQFAAVAASPPCQLYSATRMLAIAQGRGMGRAVDLLEPTRRLLLKHCDVPWIIENVERGPIRHWPGAVRLCGSSWGLKVQRHRWFAPSPDLYLEGTTCDHSVFEICPISGKPRPWGVVGSKGDVVPSGGRAALSLEHGLDCMGVTHRTMPWKYLCEGLPPVYTEHLGHWLMAHLRGKVVSDAGFNFN